MRNDEEFREPPMPQFVPGEVPWLWLSYILQLDTWQSQLSEKLTIEKFD